MGILFAIKNSEDSDGDQSVFPKKTLETLFFGELSRIIKR